MSLVKRDADGKFVRSLIYGVGIDDTEGCKERMVNGKRVIDPVYSVWKNMLKRCYFSKGDYVGKVTVCSEWHKLSNFTKWYKENYVEGCDLDKDLLSGLVYSPTTCLFIPRELNLFIMGARKECGVHYVKARGNYQAYTKAYDGKRLNLGRYSSYNDALRKAKEAKLVELGKLFCFDGFSQKIKVGLQTLWDDVYFMFVSKA